MQKHLFTFLVLLPIYTHLLAVTLSTNNSKNSLIVYNSNVGLVHEVRQLELQKDEKQIIYEDVASSINTDSVNLSLPLGVALYSQQYRFDKLTQSKLIRAHIGKVVQVKVKNDSNNFHIIKALLLSHDGNSCIVKHNKHIIIVESKNLIFKSIPKELITKPSLVWNIDTQTNVNSKLSLDYLVNNITWKSNYILNLHGDEADLTGWINIDNRSGKKFTNTELHVLAGEINKVRQPRRNYVMAKANLVYDSMPEVSHQAHEGYHFYTVPFKVTLANNEKTQIKFITQNAIAIQRKYSLRVSNPNYLNGERSHDVTQFISAKGLDLPLPSGIVRTYSQLAQTNILLGESRIKHTPKNTPFSLKLGKNFDVKVKETLLKRVKGSWSVNEDIMYTLKNSSNEIKTIELLVPFNKREGSEIKSNKKYTFTKGNLVTFRLKVPANSEKSFSAYYTTKVQK